MKLFREAQPEPDPEPETYPETQSSSLPALVHHAAEDVVKIKSIRGHLGSTLTYLEHFLSLSDIVKDVSRFTHIALPVGTYTL